MPKSAYVPEEVIIVTAGHTTVFRYTEHKEVEEEVMLAKVCVADDEKNLKLMREWAEQRHDNYAEEPIETKEIRSVNAHFHLKVVDVRYSSGGGRTYRVVDQENRLFNLHEDSMLDAIFESGIAPGGLLNGEYAWAVIQGKMRLVRIGSDMYYAALEAGKRRKLKPVRLKDLKPGTFYETKGGEIGLFVGFITTRTISKEISKAMLWLRVLPYGLYHKNEIELVEDFIDHDPMPKSVFPVIKKTHTYIREINSLDVPAGSGMIYVVRDRIRQNVADWVDRCSQSPDIYTNKLIDLEISRNAEFCNMAPYGKEPDVIYTA